MDREERRIALRDRREGASVGFVAKSTLVVLGLWALANMLWMGRELLFVVFFAALVALFLSLFVDPMEEKLGFPRAVAAVLVLLVILGGFSGMMYLLWPTLQEQFVVIQRQIPQAIADAGDWLRAQYQTITGQVGAPNGQLTQELQDRLGQEAINIVAGALPLLSTAVGALFGLFIVIFAGLYLAIQPKLYARGLILLFPPAARERMEQALGDTASDLRRWILGTVINMAIIGLLTTIGLWLLGIPAALALGLIAGLFEFIPIFGPWLAAGPAVAIALILSPTDALWVALLYVGIQQIESNVVTPLVMRGAVELPPALTMFVGALMAIMFGFLGLLLAVPILAAVMALTRRLYIQEMEAEAMAGGDGDRPARAA